MANMPAIKHGKITVKMMSDRKIMR